MAKINLKKYQEWLEKRNLSSHTISRYNWGLREYGAEELNTDKVVAFFKKNLARYEPASLHLHRCALISYAKFKKIKIEWELIDQIIPGIPLKFFETITEIELERLKQAKTRASDATNQRNNLILDFLFYTGMRVSELINIRHCDYQGKKLKIHGKGNKFRYIPLPDFLAKHFNGSSDYLFKNYRGEKMSDVWIREICYRRTKKAGLNKQISPHTFRRSLATILNKREARLTTIQKILGHSRIDTTAKYIHNSYEEIYQDYSKLWISSPPQWQFL
ncbi:putative Tyrosine recombinase XerC [endosymbiont DhMRE of Dentiscutata heterogama]|uniref:tyrosine-type recombinase/integrase n=1 Tax=endosymbiont DhMRE of Dentiscutata heterogama TaxID=1609546 RepID=UPI000629D2F0|nr:tyrosine-type recombinase/integrase [endosymbiont DhMRE of Dentiscutata heterogama]CFW93268.1 putative Tyrosine recombinase XerC [endosymbiont DhMRE of Dentiscutata heterogama]